MHFRQIYTSEGESAFLVRKLFRRSLDSSLVTEKKNQRNSSMFQKFVLKQYSDIPKRAWSSGLTWLLLLCDINLRTLREQ